MPRRDKSLLAEIERGGLDHRVPLTPTLQTITALNWDVSVARLTGVLAQIRTKLIQLVNEMRAMMGEDETVPSSKQAAQAVNVDFHGGKRHQVNVTTAQAEGRQRTRPSPRWTRRHLRAARLAVVRSSSGRAAANGDRWTVPGSTLNRSTGATSSLPGGG